MPGRRTFLFHFAQLTRVPPVAFARFSMPGNTLLCPQLAPHSQLAKMNHQEMFPHPHFDSGFHEVRFAT